MCLFLRPFLPFSFSNSIFRAIFLFIFLSLIVGILAGQKKKENDVGGGLNDLLGGLDLDGMLSGMQELLGNAAGGGPSTADGKKGLDKLKKMAANLDPKMLQDVLGKINPETINDTIKKMASPENIWGMLPANVKEMLPEGWFFIGKKIGNVLAKEWDKVTELVEGADKFGSAEELWEAMKEKTPMLADLLENDLWKGSKERWTKFEGNLGDEAKHYTENIKSTGWEWLSRKVFAPALRLSPEAKTNLKDSVGTTFPALKPLLEKAAANEKLKEWADQWKMMADLESMFSQFQTTMGGMMPEETEGETKTNGTKTEEEQMETKDEMWTEEMAANDEL